MKSVRDVLDDKSLKRRLDALWQESFNSRSDLGQFLLLETELKLKNFDREQELSALITEVALWTANGEGWVIEAFQGLCRYRPNNAALKAFGDEVGWSPEVPPDQLTGLEGAANEPVMRRYVRNYGGQIRRTAGRAAAVGIIKKLHDEVDILRRAVYLPLADTASRSSGLPDNFSVVRLRRVLLEQKRKIEALAGPPRFEDGDFPWIEEKLCPAGDALRLAAEAPASSGVDEALIALKDIVELELPALDQRLETAARDLGLADLIDCLRALSDDLQKEDLNKSRIDALDTDIEKLVRVDARLSSLVKMHRAWQRVDSALNPLENSLDLPIEDIERRWRTLSARMSAACPEGYDRDLPGLAAASEAFTASLELRDKIRLGLDFPELATLLRDRFTGIDQDLLDQCDRITAVGESLNTVVERLDG
jgi:hypothetical protein